MVSPAVMAGETSAPGNNNTSRSDPPLRKHLPQTFPAAARRDASGYAQQTRPCAHAHIHVFPQGQRGKSPSVSRVFPVSNGCFSHGEIATTLPLSSSRTARGPLCNKLQPMGHTFAAVDECLTRFSSLLETTRKDARAETSKHLRFHVEVGPHPEWQHVRIEHFQ